MIKYFKVTQNNNNKHTYKISSQIFGLFFESFHHFLHIFLSDSFLFRLSLLSLGLSGFHRRRSSLETSSKITLRVQDSALRVGFLGLHSPHLFGKRGSVSTRGRRRTKSLKNFFFFSFLFFLLFNLRLFESIFRFWGDWSITIGGFFLLEPNDVVEFCSVEMASVEERPVVFEDFKVVVDSESGCYDGRHELPSIGRPGARVR